MIGDFNKRKLLQIFVLGEAVFFLYSDCSSFTI